MEAGCHLNRKPQLISKLQDAGLTGGSREGKIIPIRENDCEVELISCIICLSLEGTNAVLLTEPRSVDYE